MLRVSLTRFSWFFPRPPLATVALTLLLLGAAPAFAATPPKTTTASTAPHKAAVAGLVQTRALRAALVGQWTAAVGNQRLAARFDDDGRFELGDHHGTYNVRGNHLTLAPATGRAGETYQFDFNPAGDQLTLKGGDLAGSLTFTRRPQWRAQALTWLSLSPRAVTGKLWHVLVILLIVLAARIILWLAQRLSYLAIFSDTGALAMFYRQRKNRARTIHLLVLNLIKYVIYFAALGLILAELGVNTTAYIASLSVLGLAIGFGSQGLVQDMVTGFFILFESQYDVGDMVDVSGQTGLVSEIGLRMTRLRNYLGQTVVIPNRNVAVVGNYLKGAQNVSIDLQLDGDDPTTLERGRTTILEVAQQVQGEFQGIVIEPPAAEVRGDSDPGRYLRLELSIWPGQAWLVDQQLLPRLREALVAAGATIRGDRITAFYHAREKVVVRNGWRWTSRRRQTDHTSD